MTALIIFLSCIIETLLHGNLINSKVGNLLALHSAQENTCMLRVYSHLQINEMRNYPSLLGTKRDKDMTQYIGTEIHIKHVSFHMVASHIHS